MPTYDYDCRHCGGFDAFRPLVARNDLVACPHCGADSARVFASAPRLALMAGSTGRAIETNERAAHAPRSSRDHARLRHPAGCGCCSGATLKAPDGAKSFPSRRPWMISH